MRGNALKSFIEATFPVIKDRSNKQELIIVCPNNGCPDETGNRSINITTGKTNCWRCGSGGDVVKWLRYLGYSVDSSPHGVTLDDFYDLFNDTPTDLVLPKIEPIKLPDGFRTCSENKKSIYTKWIRQMAERKNLCLEDLMDYGVGFTKHDNPWTNYAIFPVVEFDTVVYYQGRTYDDEYGKSHLGGTKKFPSKEEVRLSSKYWIYGIDRARKPGISTVVVVESILNVISLNKKFKECGIRDMIAVSSFRSSMTYPQIIKLFRLNNLKEVCILFDLDATSKAWGIAEKNSSLRNMTVASMPSSEDNKKLDPNDDVDLALECIEKRKKFSVVNKLLSDFSSIT